MRGKTNILLCDHEDDCDNWALDDYANTVSTVNGVVITTEQRALGWLTNRDGDFCPEHAPARQQVEPATSDEEQQA